MILTNNEKRELDELAEKVPDWQEHLKDYRKRHPEESPQQVMKKAGFTRRMYISKLVKQYLKPKFLAIVKQVKDDEEA